MPHKLIILSLMLSHQK